MINILIFFILVSCQKNSVYPVKGEIIEAVYGLGIIKSESNYHAKAAIVSSIKKFYVTEGQDVSQGEKLFLTDQGAIYSAPFSGRITEILVPIGENLFPQTNILNLIDLNKIFLEVSLEQQAAMKLNKGMKAEVSFEFFRQTKLVGIISTLYPKNDQFIAKVLMSEWPKGVLPGMSADVAFEVNRKKNATLIPTKAIANGHIVIKKKNKKEKIKVIIGLIDQEKAEILSPELLPTDEIILP